MDYPTLKVIILATRFNIFQCNMSAHVLDIRITDEGSIPKTSVSSVLFIPPDHEVSAVFPIKSSDDRNHCTGNEVL